MKRAARPRWWLMLTIGLILCLALLDGSAAWAATAPANAAASSGAASTGVASNDVAGILTGTSDQGTRLDGIEVLMFSHEVKSPREAGSGLATGRRQYQPLLIRKRIDKASPLLMRAMGRNESFPSLSFTVYEHSAGGGGGAGRPATAMTITLTNAQIVDISIGDLDGDGWPEESVSFVATQIGWSADGMSWNDDWLAPTAVTTYFMAINEKGLPGRPKKQTKASAYRTQIISPRDPQSGLPTGRRQHSPFILVMPDSSQAPELTDAFLTGRALQRVSVITYGPDGVATGAVSLVGVQVVSMTETRVWGDPHVDARRRMSGLSSNPLYEDIVATGDEEAVYELTYQKIEWLDANGVITHEDTWDAQR